MSRTHTVPAGTMASAFANAGIAAPVVPATLSEAAELNKSLPIVKQWVSYQGQMVTRAEMEVLANEADAAAAENAPVSYGTAFFDLFHTLEDLLVHPLLCARVLSSMTWILDTTAINTARSVFWDVHKEASEAGHIDDFADFLNRMAEMRANENYVEDLGFELGAGKLQSLTLLLKLSQKWHDKAQGASIGAGIKYVPKSFEQLLAGEKAQSVDALTTAKLNALVDATFDGEDSTPEEIEQAKKLVATQQSERLAAMHASRQMISPAVLRIIAYADYHDSSEADEFWQLPVELQARLINNAISTIDRTVTDLAAYKSISALEFIGLIKEAKGAKTRLNDVLKTTKFLAH